MHFFQWPSCHHRSGYSHGSPARPAEGRGWEWGGYGMAPGFGDSSDGGFGGGGAFGVRRPLRFLAHKLDLDEKQVTELARILDELKTERAQAEVDNRRALGEFADALAAEAFDAVKAGSAGERRVASAGRLREALVKSLGEIHGLLNAEQRTRFAYLIRTGVLAV